MAEDGGVEKEAVVRQCCDSFEFDTGVDMLSSVEDVSILDAHGSSSDSTMTDGEASVAFVRYQPRSP